MWKPIDNLAPDARASELAAREKVRGVARDFASFIYAQLVAAQRATVDQNEMFSGGAGEEMFSKLMDQQHAARMATNGGLTRMLENTLAARMGGMAARAYGATS